MMIMANYIFQLKVDCLMIGILDLEQATELHQADSNSKEDIGIGTQFGELTDKGLDNEDANIYDYIVDGTSEHVDKLDAEIEVLNMGVYFQRDNEDI
ncbi:MAG: hypothetical protein EZS28_033521 [Streblomastix strix]|uniref:Uncharacterized protein n=1 Tax=Streblomastix strix TaxID=222440 RepID=A0A5J4UL14_9EUKA|nr:MAG: hypothetical protein EZS28_033521 [Streblomastix strix]